MASKWKGFLIAEHRFKVLAAMLLATAVAAVATWTRAAGHEHPPLVSVEAANCLDCHGELTENKASLHPPAEEDCTTCHDLAIAEGGTEVSLVDAEPSLCLLCHDDLTAAAEAEVETPHFPVTDSCLACHDTHGSEHQGLLVASLPDLCSECHDPADLETSHGGQITAATDCGQCHEAHGSKNPALLAARRLHPPFEEGSCNSCHRAPFGDRLRLRSRGEKLCTSCHGDVTSEASANGSFHEALHGERGRAGCLSCHNPHMSDRGNLLEADGPALCGRCHAAIVASAGTETGHFPAAEDCLTCHQPHSAEQPALLAEPRRELCAGCHDPEDDDLRSAHLGAELASLDCTSCHTPHGSGNPKLLARTLHAPIEDGCDTCHEGASDRLLEGGGSELCLLCHDDVGERAQEAPAPHEALDLGSCTDCHNPHASAQDRLILRPSGGACLECHDEQGAGPGEKAHGVISLVGCRACHEPHGGDRPMLLRAEGAELCLSCHGPGAEAVPGDDDPTLTLLGRFEVPAAAARAIRILPLSADGERNHPVTGHRVLGVPTAAELDAAETNFSGELTCLTCHDPHKGRSVELLRWGAASALEACIQCHPK